MGSRIVTRTPMSKSLLPMSSSFMQNTPTPTSSKANGRTASVGVRRSLYGGENSAVLFRDGQRYDARWVRTVREDIITLRTMDDEILYLKPGNTWIQVIRDPQQQDPNAEWLITE